VAEGEDNDVGFELPDGLVTPTLAGIYLQQGHTGQALAIYRKLAERAPGDRDLRRMVTTLEQRLDSERAKERRLEQVDELKRLLRRIQKRRRDRGKP